MLRQAVFLDRDGTINVEKHHLYKTEDWEWIPGAVEAIRGFRKLGFMVVVVTNQSGIARGLYTDEDVRRLHLYVDTLLEAEAARIDAYYYCPHHPDYGEKKSCNCRKPRPGLLLQAQGDFGIDLGSSFMIGDKYSDILSGRAAGARTIMVVTGYGRDEYLKAGDKSIALAGNLYEAYKLIETGYMRD